MQLRQVGADLVEHLDDLGRLGEHEPFARIGRAVSQQGRGRVAPGVDLDRIERDPGGLDVGAHQPLPRIDLAGVRGPAILRIQPVGQQDDDLLILIAGSFRRGIERIALRQGLPAPGETDRLVGVAVRRHGVDLRIERRPVVAQPHHLGRAGAVLLGREQGRGDTGQQVDVQRVRHGVPDVIVLVAVGDAAVPGVVIGDGDRRRGAGPGRSRADPADIVERTVIADAGGERRAGASVGKSGYRVETQDRADSDRRHAAVNRVDGIPQLPIEPVAAPVRRAADIDVLVERNDRHIDVAIGDRGGPQLADEVLGRGLERRHLARVRHRPGVVEHQGDAQAGRAPARGRGDRDRQVPELRAHDPHDAGVVDGGGGDDHGRPVGVAVGRRHLEVVHVGALEQRPVIVVARGLQVTRVQRRRGLRDRQRSRVAGRLHAGLDQAGMAVVDRRPGEPQHGNESEGEDHEGVALLGARELAPRDAKLRDQPFRRHDTPTHIKR